MAGREAGTVIVVLGNKGCGHSLTIYFSQVRYGVWRTAFLGEKRVVTPGDGDVSLFGGGL